MQLNNVNCKAYVAEKIIMIILVMNLGHLSYGHNVSCCEEAPQKIATAICSLTRDCKIHGLCAPLTTVKWSFGI